MAAPGTTPRHPAGSASTGGTDGASAAAHLEWDALAQGFIERLVSPLMRVRVKEGGGARHARALPQTTDAALADRWLDELDALEHVAGPDGGTALGAALARVVPIEDLLTRASRGAVLDIEELAAVADCVDAASKAARLLEEAAVPADTDRRVTGAPTVLREELRGLAPPAELTERLSMSIERHDEDAVLADTASPTLGNLRKRAEQARRAVRAAAEHLLRRRELHDALADRYWTHREGRVVLPVRSDGFARSDAPGKISGIIHDSSASGQTLFVEPHDLIEPANAQRQAQMAVAAEERRVLASLSEAVGSAADALAGCVEALAHLDHVRARLRLSRQLSGVRPRLGRPDEDLDDLQLPEARHPLMLLRGDHVVPNDLQARVGQALVVSGPNAGGKTVALKTMGLCVMMTRAGLRLPTSSEARVPLFRAIVTDVGDDQSIARNLSTFSAHIGHLRNALHDAAEDGPGTLVLLDEVAGGTDPEQGAALAEAVLERLVELGATVVVTTHYERLKLMASRRPEAFVNAAVGFDLADLRPTFRLTFGAPGSSSAIAVARRLGMPELVVQRAELLLSDERMQVDALLRELESEREGLHQARARLEREDAALRDREARLTAREEGKLASSRVRRTKAHEAAMGELRAFEEEIRRRRKALRRTEPRPETRGRPSDADARSFARQARQQLMKTRLPEAAPAGAPVPRLREGLYVHVQTFGAEGEVVAIKGDRVTVQLPGAKVTLSREDLRPAADPRHGRESRTQPAKVESDSGNAIRHFGAEARPVRDGIDNVVDLRGLRADEAVTMLEVFLDRCIAEDREVVIVKHGHGSGALRKAVREHLPRLRHVVRHRPGLPPEGGDAVTVIWVRG